MYNDRHITDHPVIDMSNDLSESTPLLPSIDGCDSQTTLLPTIDDGQTPADSPDEINGLYVEMLRVLGPWPIRQDDPSGTRIVVIGNTFGRMPDVPPGDILIHTGNFCDEYGGNGAEVVDWLISLPHRIKIITPGTYDNQGILRWLEDVRLGEHDGGVILLSGATTLVDGLRIFAPYTDPYSAENSISPYTTNDIFLTHLQPEGILDKRCNITMGCGTMLEMLLKHPPRICITGSIASGYGYCWCYLDDEEPTLCINAAMYSAFDHVGSCPNQPIVLSIAYM